jgi:cytochrome P450
VRVARGELAFCDPQAWKDIMGHRTGAAGGGEAEMLKWDKFYKPVDGVPSDIVNAGREEHALLRRAMAHGFSDRSMREQQPLIKGYVDMLIRRLRENGEGGKKLDIMAWYNFTTFDVIGDLAFGER